MVKLKSLKRREPLPFEAIFALSSEKRDFLSPLADMGASNHFHRAFFWKPRAFTERHLTKELANPAMSGSRACNMNLLGPESRRKHILCDPVAPSSATGQEWGTLSRFFPPGEWISRSPVVLERCSVWLLLPTNGSGNCPTSSPKQGHSQQKGEPLLLLPSTDPLPGTAARCCFPGKTHHWESAPHCSFLVFSQTTRAVSHLAWAEGSDCSIILVFSSHGERLFVWLWPWTPLGKPGRLPDCFLWGRVPSELLFVQHTFVCRGFLRERLCHPLLLLCALSWGPGVLLTCLGPS